MTCFLKLKSNGEFRRAYAKGKCLHDKAFTIYVYKNRKQGRRLGITTGKKLGNAVTRNRARRIIRVAFREISPMLKSGYDYVVVARPGIINMKSTQVYERFVTRFKDSGYMSVEGKND